MLEKPEETFRVATVEVTKDPGNLEALCKELLLTEEVVPLPL